MILKNTDFDIKTNFDKINQIIPAGAKVIGWYAPQLCFNRCDITVIPGMPYPVYLERYNPDFILDASNSPNSIPANYYKISELYFKAVKLNIFVYKKL